MTERYQIDALERHAGELGLRLTAIDGNAMAFHVQRNFALQLVLDAASESSLTRDLARQLGSARELHDDPCVPLEPSRSARGPHF